MRTTCLTLVSYYNNCTCCQLNYDKKITIKLNTVWIGNVSGWVIPPHLLRWTDKEALALAGRTAGDRYYRQQFFIVFILLPSRKLLRSIVMSTSVCLCVCPSVRISPGQHAWSLPNLLCTLPMAVARSSSGRLTKS